VALPPFQCILWPLASSVYSVILPIAFRDPAFCVFRDPAYRFPDPAFCSATHPPIHFRYIEVVSIDTPNPGTHVNQLNDPHAPNSGWTYFDRIQRKDAGESVLSFYTKRYSHTCEANWRERIRDGSVTLDEAVTDPERILSVNQKLAYHRSPWVEPDAPTSYAVLFEDESILVVAKPSGLPVLPGGNFLEKTLLSQVRRHYPAELEPAPIHRIGRGTSASSCSRKPSPPNAHCPKTSFTAESEKSTEHSSRAPKWRTPSSSNPQSERSPIQRSGMYTQPRPRANPPAPSVVSSNGTQTSKSASFT